MPQVTFFDSKYIAQDRWKKDQHKREHIVSKPWALFSHCLLATIVARLAQRLCDRGLISQQQGMEIFESKSLIILRHIKTKAMRETIWLQQLEDSASHRSWCCPSKGRREPRVGGGLPRDTGRAREAARLVCTSPWAHFP